jgi:adenosylcobalamin phosphodiesterase
MVMTMRLGTTSYIYPADIMTNVRRLAGKVQDVELVIFEFDDRSNGLPDDDAIAELNALAAAHDMTYTVHLPFGLGLADEQPSVSKALQVIRGTERLQPHGFIVHLDGKARTAPDELKRWTDNSLRSLEIICNEVLRPELVCVENLDDQPPIMLDSILDKTPVSCCVDIGHLWKQGLDPVPVLDRWLSRARVVHIHGVGKRDHKRLSLMPEAILDPVVESLHRLFRGVLTLEVFSERDFLDSLAAFQESSLRCRQRR